MEAVAVEEAAVAVEEAAVVAAVEAVAVAEIKFLIIIYVINQKS